MTKYIMNSCLEITHKWDTLFAQKSERNIRLKELSGFSQKISDVAPSPISLPLNPENTPYTEMVEACKRCNHEMNLVGDLEHKIESVSYELDKTVYEISRAHRRTIAVIMILLAVIAIGAYIVYTFTEGNISGFSQSEITTKATGFNLSTENSIVQADSSRISDTSMESNEQMTENITNDSGIYTRNNVELIFIPAGSFIMGSDKDDDPYLWGAESPSHQVELDAFYIYRTEVTNDNYRACVSDGACPSPVQLFSPTRSDYYTNSAYGDYPVIYVTWYMAQSYCKWAGGRLPSEAEWEKAARGDDGRLFPWGNQAPSGSLTNFTDSGLYDTSAVGSYPAGASPYGLLDMSGNVWEWVADWFSPGYSSASLQNPTGAKSGEHRVVRGGAWSKSADAIRAVVRYGVNPDISLNTVGFRCAQDSP